MTQTELRLGLLNKISRCLEVRIHTELGLGLLTKTMRGLVLLGLINSRLIVLVVQDFIVVAAVRSNVVGDFVVGLALFLLTQNIDIGHDFLPSTFHRLLRLVVVSLTQNVESSDLLNSP